MLLFEIIQIFMVPVIGLLMFFGLFRIQDLLCGIRPLRKRGKEGKKPDKGSRNAILLIYTITQLMIAVMIFLLIKLILRGEL